jgi:hypothetical protein
VFLEKYESVPESLNANGAGNPLRALAETGKTKISIHHGDTKDFKELLSAHTTLDDSV